MVSLAARAVFVLLLVVTTWSIAHGVDDEEDPTATCRADGTCDTCRADGTCDSNDCVDKHVRCLFWAQLGECVNNQVFMTTSCPQSCELCIGNDLLFPWDNDDDCKDFYDTCERWQREGECFKNPTFMGPNCRLSCRKCVNVDKLREAGVDDLEM